MKGQLAIVFLMGCSMLAGAQEWHPVPSSFCSQIKAKGAKVAGRPFSILEASNAGTRCCEGLNPKVEGNTEDFGHFKVLDLENGHYFLSFDLKTKKINVPIVVNRPVDKRSIGKECEPTSRITVDKATNQVTWGEWVNVD